MRVLLIYGLDYALLVLLGVLLALASRRVRRGAWLWPAAAGLALIAFLTVVSEPVPKYLFSDFLNAYRPAGFLIRRAPYQMYAEGELKFVNLPILALLFAPLSHGSPWRGVSLFTGLGIGAVAAACYLLVRLTKVSGWRRFALVGLVLANGPLYYSFKEGNLTHFVLLLLVPAFLCLEKRRDVALGVLLALAGLIKLPLFLLAAYFAWRGRWRVVAACAGTTLAIAAASVVLFGVDLHRFWVSRCIQPFASKPLVAFNVQSVSGLVARQLTEGQLNSSLTGSMASWRPVAVDGRYRVWHNGLLALLAGAVLLSLRRPGSPVTPEVELTELSIVLCLALVCSPVSWTHYYLFLVLPAALYLGNRVARPQGRSWTALAVVAFLLTWPPVISLESSQPLGRFLTSHYVLGALLLLVFLLAGRWSAAFAGPEGDVPPPRPSAAWSGTRWLG